MDVRFREYITSAPRGIKRWYKTRLGFIDYVMTDVRFREQCFGAQGGHEAEVGSAADGGGSHSTRLAVLWMVVDA